MSSIPEMLDEQFLHAVRGPTTTNTTAQEAPPVTVDSMLASSESIKAVMRDLAPSPTRVIESRFLVDVHEDWSKVRSPGRARRRRKHGHRQNIRVWETPKKEAYQIDGKLFVHPATWRAALIASRQSTSGEGV
jgi:hypothetical protein